MIYDLEQKIKIEWCSEIVASFFFWANRQKYYILTDARMIRTNKMKLGEMVIFQLRIDCYHTM